MIDQLITFETAKLAKEKGFRAPGYHLSDIERYTKETYLSELPTQSLLQRWLREVHNIEVYAAPFSPTDNDLVYLWCVYKKISTGKYFTTYESALEAGLQEALKLINL